MKSTANTTRSAATNTRRNSTQGSGRSGTSRTTAATATATRPGSRSPAPQGQTQANSGKAMDPNMAALADLKVPTTATVPLIDPTSFGGLIQVPVLKTSHTKGRTEYFQGILRKEVSLCCLFQKGRCHAGEKCHQIHVDTNFMKNVRAQNAHVVSCCRACKDTASLSSSAVSFFASHCADQPQIKLVSPDGRYSVVDSDKIAITTGLIQHVEQQQISTITSLPVKKMCRLHLRGVCKYGKDCKNIHVCTKLGERVLEPLYSPAPGERTSASVTPASSRAATPPPQVRQCSCPQAVSPSSSSVSPAPERPRHVKPAPASIDGDSRRGSIDSVMSQGPMPISPANDALDDSADANQRLIDITPLGPHSPALLDNDSRPMSFSQLDLNNISFMERTCPTMSGLCFDPSMALDLDLDAAAVNVSAQKAQPNLSADWFSGNADYGVSAGPKPF